jgi:crotonobetainyl-CoA:carnitine CoA-transferase CaiB-like acyl-CoA transferase
MGPGGHCSKTLADLGADVIRVVEAGGAAGRRGGRRADTNVRTGYGMRRNTRAIGMDLKDEAVRAVFLRLVGTADVVVVGFRPGVAERLGIGYERLREVNPRLVYAQLSGFGASGPYARVAGHDINYQAMAGLLDANRPRPESPPAPPGATIGDSAGGLAAALAILAALVARAETGQGQYLDVASTDALVGLMAVPFDRYLQTGELPGPGETYLTGQFPYYNVYETKDGKYLAVGAIEPYFYENLCRALGLEQYAAHQDAEEPLRSEICAAFGRAFAARTRDEWTATLMPEDTCVTPVYTLAEAAADPHLRERGMVLDWTGPDGQTYPMVGPLVRPSESPPRIRHVWPETGAETEGILAEVGVSGAEIATLRSRGVLI